MEEYQTGRRASRSILLPLVSPGNEVGGTLCETDTIVDTQKALQVSIEHLI